MKTSKMILSLVAGIAAGAAAGAAMGILYVPIKGQKREERSPREEKS